jgi:hypothetical protein
MNDAALILEIKRLRAEAAEQRAEVRELREDLQFLMRALLTASDKRNALRFLPLIADVIGERPFTAPQVLAAALNDRTPAGQALRELVREFVTDDGGLRTFGKLLSRIEGAPLAGCRLISAGEGRDGRRWRVVRVSGA